MSTKHPHGPGETEEGRLSRQHTRDSSDSIVRLSSTDKQLERINHDRDLTPDNPGSSTWGVQCLRSPTLDEPDEFITDRPLGMISKVTLPGKPTGSTWDLEIEDGRIKDIAEHDPAHIPPVMSNSINACSALLTPSLCHPHVHIDKAYLLSHPRYSDLQIQRGTFDEAMELTGKAKVQFTEDDLLQRGQRLIDESVAVGVTHMRAFVEVDIVVGLKCLNAGLTLKRRAEKKGRCHVQICAFAQLPLFTTAQDDQDGDNIRKLMTQAAAVDEVEVLGSTPYVEDSTERMQRNIEWLVDLAQSHDKHIDFHLDYNLDPKQRPMVWHVVKTLREKQWKEKTVVLGHCTRLTLFGDDEWHKLKKEIGDLPISFVGLPTSDLFMMRTENKTRGTLDVPALIKMHGLNACIGINNIGNAFTPQGSCDPLTLACNGVGIYQAGTEKDAELLFECVSTRARKAIGLDEERSPDKVESTLEMQQGQEANLLLFSSDHESPWRTRRKVSEAVYLYDHATGRRVVHRGKAVE